MRTQSRFSMESFLLKSMSSKNDVTTSKTSFQSLMIDNDFNKNKTLTKVINNRNLCSLEPDHEKYNQTDETDGKHISK